MVPRERLSPSDDGGWERCFGPERWLLWKDGNVYAGTRNEINANIDGQRSGELVAEKIITGVKLLKVIQERGLEGPRYLE